MHGISTVAGLAAAGPDATGFYTWLTGSPVHVILALVALGLLVAANRAQLSKVVKVGIIVIIAMAIMFGNWKGLGEWLAGWLGGK